MPKPIKETMTPEEVATFWYQKSIELEAKLKDSEDYWFKHSSDLEDKLAQSEAARRELASEFGDLKNKYTALDLLVTSDKDKLEARIYQAEMRAGNADLERRQWRDECREMKKKIKQLSDEIVEATSQMTYEQIIDLKCENARLREENAKFTKWKRILDKFKIF